MKKAEGQSPEPQTGGEEGIFAARRAKADALRARGENPFANDVDATDRALVQELRRRFEPALVGSPSELRYDAEAAGRIAGDAPVHLFGRITARRGFGKAV